MVLADPDPDWLAERSERGIDRWDEVWDGVLHVPPSPTTAHQELVFELRTVTADRSRSLSACEIIQQLTVFDPTKGERNYRTPDMVIAAPINVSERGIEGHAELVIEILSPNDESRNKFEFYAARQIPEYWLVDPKTRGDRGVRPARRYVFRGDAAS